MSNLTYTVIDAADSSLNKTSVLVTGETEALVVDAAFTRADGHRIVAEVLDSGKRLTTVVLSAGDPDFYFGAEVIADAFPEAVFLAPPTSSSTSSTATRASSRRGRTSVRTCRPAWST